MKNIILYEYRYIYDIVCSYVGFQIDQNADLIVVFFF